MKQRVAGMSLLLVGMLVLVGCGEKYTPSFSPQVGDKRLVKIRMKVATNVNMMGQDITTNQGSMHKIQFEVTEVAVDGMVSMKGVFEEVDMDMDSMVTDMLPMMTGGKVDAKALSDMIHAASGKEFSVEVTPAGKILSTSGLSTLSSELLRDAKLELGQAKPIVEGMLMQMLSEDMVKNTLESVFDYAHNEAVAIGNSWVKEQEVVQQLPIDIKNTVTLLSHENGQANFQMDTVFSGSGSGGGIPGMDMDVEMDIEGNGTGSARVDTVSSWPEMVEQESNMDIIIKAGNIPGMNEDLKQKMKISYTALIEAQ